MKKNDQDLFYAAVGRELTKFRERRKLSISQLAAKVNEEFNTIKAIEDGKPFMAHQISWMKSILDINLNILITDALNTNNISIKEDDNGQESTPVEETSSLSDYL